MDVKINNATLPSCDNSASRNEHGLKPTNSAVVKHIYTMTPNIWRCYNFKKDACLKTWVTNTTLMLSVLLVISFNLSNHTLS